MSPEQVPQLRVCHDVGHEDKPDVLRLYVPLVALSESLYLWD